MENKLPARPNLEHLRGQSKALLSAAHAGEPDALAEFACKRGEQALATAQLAVARRYGFQSWPKLVHYVDTLEKLKGEWTFTSLEMDGTLMPNPGVQGARIVFDGQRFQMLEPGVTYEGRIELDVEGTPPKIDICFEKGSHAGQKSLGIYDLTRDKLTICLGLTGVARPMEFSTVAGGGLALETLVRTSVTMEDEAGRQPVETGVPEDFWQLSPEHHRLQGEWESLALARNGMQMPDDFAKSGRRAMEGTLVTIRFGGQAMMQALTRIDASLSPIEIDYLIADGPNEGQIQLGIMRWHGEEFETCFGTPGQPRPQAFESLPGSQTTLSRWRKSPV